MARLRVLAATGMRTSLGRRGKTLAPAALTTTTAAVTAILAAALAGRMLTLALALAPLWTRRIGHRPLACSGCRTG
jgi:hypothetical protein